MSDEIFLDGLRFYGYHGVNLEERVQGQRFVVDLTMETNLQCAGETDDLDQTVDYSAVYARVRDIVEGEQHDLIETVAETIAAEILAAFPVAQAISVTVRKPEVAIKGAMLDSAGVRIRRAREKGDT